jgi:hypothetical protein
LAQEQSSHQTPENVDRDSKGVLAVVVDDKEDKDQKLKQNEESFSPCATTRWK